MRGAGEPIGVGQAANETHKPGPEGCKALRSLLESVGALTALASGAQPGLPPGLVGALTGLTTLDLEECKALTRLLPGSVGAAGLTSRDLEACGALERLPDLVGRLTGLTNLHLRECKKQESLPGSVGALTMLKRLDLS
jgi:hypothetical protein